MMDVLILGKVQTHLKSKLKSQDFKHLLCDDVVIDQTIQYSTYHHFDWLY